MQGQPGKYQKTLLHGQSWESEPFSLVTEAGVAIALGAATITAALRSARGRYPVDVVVSPEGSAFKLFLSQAQILAMPLGKYLFDLVVEDVLPQDLVFLRGEWAIAKGASFEN